MHKFNAIPGENTLSSKVSFGANLRYPLGIAITPLNKVLGLEFSICCNISISWCIIYRLLSDVPTTFGIGITRFPPGFLPTYMYAFDNTPVAPSLITSSRRYIPFIVQPVSTLAEAASVGVSVAAARFVTFTTPSAVPACLSTTCFIRFTGRSLRLLLERNLATITRGILCT